MPELPDLVGFKQYLDSTSLHQRIEHTSIDDDRILEKCSAQKLYRRLKDAEIERSVQHGKYLLAGLSTDGWLVLHFGMTGESTYYERDREPPEHTHLLLDFAGGAHLAYISVRMLGHVSLADDPDAYLMQHNVGPDALSDEVTEERFVEAMSGRRGGAKSALMDQSLFSGMGNVFSDEVLFHAGLHPEAKPRDLGEDRLGDLYKAMRKVLTTAAGHGGDTSGLRKWLLHHRKKGERCPRCKGQVQSISSAGRRAWFCPDCQSMR